MRSGFGCLRVVQLLHCFGRLGARVVLLLQVFLRIEPLISRILHIVALRRRRLHHCARLEVVTTWLVRLPGVREARNTLDRGRVRGAVGLLGLRVRADPTNLLVSVAALLVARVDSVLLLELRDLRSFHGDSALFFLSR